MSLKRYTSDKDRILDNMKIDSTTGCWEWQKCRRPEGYGLVWYKGATTGAHRLSYMLLSNPSIISPIPDGLFVLHRCDNPGCVNPTHLFLGTNQDNVSDMTAKGRGPNRKGDKNPYARLTSSDVPRILDMLRAGETQVSISKKFGVGPNTISRINLGHSWTHITGIGSD